MPAEQRHRWDYSPLPGYGRGEGRSASSVVVQPAHPPAGSALPIHQRRDEAYKRYQVGDAAAAAAICQEILRHNPQHTESIYLLGAIALDAGHIDRATELFRQATRLAPENAVFANALGEVLLQQGNRIDAEAAFRQAVRLRPEYDRVHNNLGRLLHMQGDLPRAAEHFAEAVRLNPQYDRA